MKFSKDELGSKCSFSYSLLKKNFNGDAFFFTKLKKCCSGELFHAVTSDHTRHANLAINSLIP